MIKPRDAEMISCILRWKKVVTGQEIIRGTDLAPLDNLPALARVHELLTLLRQNADPLPQSRTELESPFFRDSALDGIADAMTQVAWCATELDARSITELKAKAQILLNWTGEETSDVSDQLAHSLCRDVAALKMPEKM
jgi:hypothetical protein